MANAKQIIDSACAYAQISRATLCRRLNVSPQTFYGKISRDKLTTTEWYEIGKALGAETKIAIIFPDDKTIT